MAAERKSAAIKRYQRLSRTTPALHDGAALDPERGPAARQVYHPERWQPRFRHGIHIERLSFGAAAASLRRSTRWTHHPPFPGSFIYFRSTGDNRKTLRMRPMRPSRGRWPAPAAVLAQGSNYLPGLQAPKWVSRIMTPRADAQSGIRPASGSFNTPSFAQRFS